MDYVIFGAVKWMEMDARVIHFHVSMQWTVDVEWIASLLILDLLMRESFISSPHSLHVIFH